MTVNAAPNSSMSRMRWTICALVFVATTINYMDRQVLGLLAPTLEKEIGWSEIQYGNIVTAFQAAYALGLLGFGRFIDVAGARRGYALPVAFWSLAAMAHALVKSAFGFGVVRFALGLGEAGNFPAAVKVVTEWFPRRERALATGLFNSGSNIGAIIAPLLVPWLTLRYGWQSAFVLLGATGFLWMAAWLLLYETPARSRRVSPAELAHIRSDTPEPAVEKTPWRKLWRYRQTWAFVVGMSFSAPIWWFFLYWLPKFLHQQHGLDLARMGLPLVVIYSMTLRRQHWRRVVVGLVAATGLVAEFQPQDRHAGLCPAASCRSRLPRTPPTSGWRPVSSAWPPRPIRAGRPTSSRLPRTCFPRRPWLPWSDWGRCSARLRP